MKKRMFVFLIVILMILAACSTPSVKTGRYVIESTETEEWIMIDINEGNMYEFNRALNTSYRPSGKYSIEKDKLILHVGDNSSYTFKISGNSLIFESTTTNGNFIKNGTVFTLKKK